MNYQTLVSLHTMNKDVLHKAALYLHVVTRLEQYMGLYGALYIAYNREGEAFVMPKSVYGYMMNGEGIHFPAPIEQGELPKALRCMDSCRNQNYDTIRYYEFDEE